MYKKVFEKLKSFTITQLVFMPIFIGFLLICVLVLVDSSFKATSFDIIALNVVFIVFGCSGIPIIVYRELPSPWRIKGFAAVFDGVLILLAAWIIPVLSLLKFIANISR